MGERRDQHYESLFMAMSEGFALCESILDDSGKLVDYLILEINPALQAMLLRALSSGEFYRMGSNTPLRSRPFIVAASNRDLLEEAEQGRLQYVVTPERVAFCMQNPPGNTRAAARQMVS